MSLIISACLTWTVNPNPPESEFDKGLHSICGGNLYLKCYFTQPSDRDRDYTPQSKAIVTVIPVYARERWKPWRLIPENWVTTCVALAKAALESLDGKRAAAVSSSDLPLGEPHSGSARHTMVAGHCYDFHTSLGIFTTVLYKRKSCKTRLG